LALRKRFASDETGAGKSIPAVWVRLRIGLCCKVAGHRG
jgi:hypothetical protein